MSDKKQIEEMAKVLKDYTKENHIMASHTILENYAEALYNAGYRKQEWISVKDRLPKDDEIVTICTEKGFVYAGELIGDTWFLDNDSLTANVTHWMPLPEPPKMKGGE